MFYFLYAPYLLASMVSIIIVAVVVAGCFWGMRWWKKRRKREARAAAAEVLRQAQRMARLQQARAQEYQDGFSPVKSNPTADFLLSVSQAEEVTTPHALLAALGGAAREGKLAVRLLQLRDDVCRRRESLRDCLLDYTVEIKQNELLYYQNLHELSRMHDELGRFMQNKNFDKTNGALWYEGYFGIFSAWFRNGANKEMQVTYAEIVQKVIALNQLERFIPFVIQTGSCAQICSAAYQRILALNKGLQEKLGLYLYEHKRAYKTARFILQRWAQPEEKKTKTTPVIIPKEKTEKMIPGSELLMENGPRTMGRRVWRAAAVLALLSIGLYLLYPLAAGHTAKTTADTAARANLAALTDSTRLQPLPADTSGFSILFDADGRASQYVYGIDISKYQGNLIEDMPNMDTLHFLICKATEDTGLVDRDFEKNWNFVREKGLIRGAYHFFHNENPPGRQAELFLKTVHLFHANDLPPILDVEELSLHRRTSARTLDSQLLIFLQQVEEQTGRRPIIYSDLSFANKYLTDERLGKYPLWLAEYSRAPNPHVPTVWEEKGFSLWQRTSSYPVYAQKTDFDLFNGDGAAFMEFIRSN